MKARPALVLAAAAALGCEPAPPPVGLAEAGASPNASILPAPLPIEPSEIDAGTNGDAGFGGIPADSAGRLILPDAGAAPPEKLQPASPVPVENPQIRDVAGVTLDAVFRWRDVPAPPKAPEVSGEGLREALKSTALTWKIDLAETGRMRVEFTSSALPLPAHSELRARADRYGHLLLWPNATTYRVLPPGTLRTVLGERRVDVTPLAAGTVKPQGEGKRLGVSTRKVELGSPHGSLKLEIGKVAEAGEGGMLLCRALVEIVGIDPKTPTCQPGEVPLHAAYAWQEGGGVAIEVTAMTKRTDLATNNLLCPPPGVSFAPSGLPSVPHGIFLTREEIMAFRTGPLTLPPVRDPGVPGEGFVAANHSDHLMYLLVDGVPTVAVAPGAEQYVIGPHRGRYHVQWRTFLGERIAPPQAVEFPARFVYGAAPDAGAPDGG